MQWLVVTVSPPQVYSVTVKHWRLQGTAALFTRWTSSKLSIQTPSCNMWNKSCFFTQINIDCVTREEISKNVSPPRPNCFNRAQRLIYGLMENDCYPRFLKSEIYQTLLEQAEHRWKLRVRYLSEWLHPHFGWLSLESRFKQAGLVCQRKQKWREIQIRRIGDWQDLKA